MSNYAVSLKRTTTLLAALAFTAMMLLVNFASFFGHADATAITSRKVVLSSNLDGNNTTGAANTETNGSDVSYAFTFTVPAVGNPLVKAFEFQFCTTAVGSCTLPTGLVANSTPAVTLQQDDASTFTNPYAFAGPGSANLVRFTSSSGNTINAGSVITFTIDDVTNPTTNGTFFVHIKTYSSDSSFITGTTIDDGTVAFAITEEIVITAKVAETLGFSTTGEIDTTHVPAPSTNCAVLTGTGAITLGDPTENTLAIDSTYDNYSAFRVYTNAATGVSIQYEGDTLRRGSLSSDPDVDPIGSTQIESNEGSEQFGLAVDTVAGGTADVDSTSRADMDFTNINAAAALALDGPLTIDSEYANGNGLIQDDPASGAGTAQFAFETNAVAASRVPDTLATSAGYVNCKTVAVRYIANISPLTTSGTYTTKIVYSAVPTF